MIRAQEQTLEDVLYAEARRENLRRDVALRARYDPAAITEKSLGASSVAQEIIETEDLPEDEDVAEGVGEDLLLGMLGGVTIQEVPRAPVPLPVLHNTKRRVDYTLERMSRMFWVEPENVRDVSKRTWNYMRPRQLVIYLCHSVWGLGYAEIGRHFKTDHGTTRNACLVAPKHFADPDLCHGFALVEQELLAIKLKQRPA